MSQVPSAVFMAVATLALPCSLELKDGDDEKAHLTGIESTSHQIASIFLFGEF